MHAETQRRKEVVMRRRLLHCLYVAAPATLLN
jgi:hypothetical protein